MKILFALSVIVLGGLMSEHAQARDHYVNGYSRANGGYVEPHYATNPDHMANNNYGTSGNINPYTQHEGRLPANPYEAPGIYNTGNGYSVPEYKY